MGEAMKQQRLKTGITQHDFKARTGSRVTGEGCVDFVSQVSKEHRCHYMC
jgi:hypothetical protein